MSMTNVSMNSGTRIGTRISLSKQSRKDESSIQDTYPVVAAKLSPSNVPKQAKRQQQQQQQQQQYTDVATTREQSRIVVANDCTNNKNDEENCFKNHIRQKQQQQQHQLEKEDVDMITNTVKRTSCSILQCVKCCCCVRSLIILLLVALTLFICIDTLSNGYIKSYYLQYIQWTINNPIAGCSVYVVIFIISTTILFVPICIVMICTGYIFTTIYGIVFGILIATVISCIGSIISSIIQFIVSRYIVRNYIQQQIQQQQCEWIHRYQLLHSLQQSIQQQKKCGLRILVVVQLSPINNFIVINYICGISSVSFYTYCISLLALLPGIVVCTIIGALINNLSSVSSQYPSSTTLHIILCIVCIIVCIVTICLLTYYTRKEIHRTAYEIQIEYSTNDQYVTHADVIDLLFDDSIIIKNNNNTSIHTIVDDNNNINNNGGVNDTFDDEYSQQTVDYKDNKSYNNNNIVDKTTKREQHGTKFHTIE